MKGVIGTKELCSCTEGTSAESRDHQGPVQRGCLQDDLGGYNGNRELCEKASGTVKVIISAQFNGGSESTVRSRFH